MRGIHHSYMRASFLRSAFAGVMWGDSGLADLMDRCAAVFAAAMIDGARSTQTEAAAREACP